ncbi:MAG: hypothetical protein NUV50_00310 [Rhodospirillales bacterium]|nr:hypothetical protein [Rhodospirillales bacterium]
MTDDDAPAPKIAPKTAPKSTRKNDAEAALHAALRANLHKRKQQGRARVGEPAGDQKAPADQAEGEG